MEDWELDKSKLKDEKGRYITQGLFLELQYNIPLAVYTLDGEHKEYKGKFYPSIKKLYLEMEDVTEYDFANTYFFDWDHWKRLEGNKLIMPHIEKCRNELELAMRATGMRSVIDAATAPERPSYQAAKFLVDGGWIQRQAGRPSKEEVESELTKRAKIREDFEEDFKLLEGNFNGD